MRGLKAGVMIIALVCVLALRVEAAPQQFGNNCYEFVQVADPFVGDNNAWWTARDAAAASIFDGVHGHLATVSSKAENDFLFTLILHDYQGFGGAWLGGNASGWLVGPESGQTLGYQDWGGIEPNNGGYAYMVFGSEFRGINPGQWADDGGVVGVPESSGDPVLGYLVEYESVNAPEPSCVVLLGMGAASLFAYAWGRRRQAAKCAMMRGKRAACCLAPFLVALSATITQASVFDMSPGQTSLEFVTIGDAGNLADTTGYGSVGYTYRMGKYDVTFGQYCQFLNAVAKTDTYGLYNDYLTNGYMVSVSTVKITRSGNSGNYSYSVTGSYNQGANCPITNISWGDAARFCNWLQNGQPATGREEEGTTESGAYTLNGDTTNLMEPRNTGATYFIPSENEWYKAAYYKGGSLSAGYWTYTTKSNTTPTNTLSPTGTNNANFFDAENGGYTDPANLLTPVGAFAASPGPYGTYDMGGDVWQWNEKIVDSYRRGIRGGVWGNGADDLAASCSTYNVPWNMDCNNGFRVASVPEPRSITLLLFVAATLLVYAWRRRRCQAA